MAMPKEYEGREQSYLKHLVLDQYLKSWAQKLGSTSRHRKTSLVYVDCFAGPWKSEATDRSDTSVHIGLEALERALTTWGNGLSAKAIFVEKDPLSFDRLSSFLNTRARRIEMLPLLGEFGGQVERINREIGSSPAFLFVDPTGWKGAAMKFIAPLARAKHRDVLINVMFNHVNRFKDDSREFLRDQMREFFGLEDQDIPQKLGEDELLAFYRERLRSTCGVPYVANLAIPSPTRERTWFHLVVGGHHPEVLNLFRTVERKVCGEIAALVRTDAKDRASGQGSLFSPEQDPSYEDRHRDSMSAARALLRTRSQGHREPFLVTWTTLLAGHHLTRTDVVNLVRELIVEGRVSATPARPRTVVDEAWLTWR